MAWRLAGSPTSRSPLSVKATTLGVRRLPSWLGMTLTSPPSMTATTELVVPRSIPMIFSSAMSSAPWLGGAAGGACSGQTKNLTHGVFRSDDQELEAHYVHRIQDLPASVATNMPPFFGSHVTM